LAVNRQSWGEVRRLRLAPRGTTARGTVAGADASGAGGHRGDAGPRSALLSRHYADSPGLRIQIQPSFSGSGGIAGE